VARLRAATANILAVAPKKSTRMDARGGAFLSVAVKKSPESDP